MPHTTSEGMVWAKPISPALHRRTLQRLRESPCEGGTFPFTLPFGVVEATNAAGDAFVQQAIQRAQHDVQCLVETWKKRAFSATIYCSAQEYETLPTKNADDDHCEEMEWGGQYNTQRFPRNARV